MIISAYNGERFIADAVESILNQSFPDFELLVINDGSTDRTLQILQNIQDDRVRITSNDENIGIAGSQNKAIALARGEYLALMDHDDVSLPERLQMQVDFLDSHPEMGLVGSSCLRIDENDVVGSIAPYFTDEIALKWKPMLCACPLFHTSLMIRRSAMDKAGGYTGKYLYAGDYELISNLVDNNSVASLARPLVKWRAHISSASSIYAEKLLEEAMTISRENVKNVLDNGEVDEEIWSGVKSLLMSHPTSEVNISSDRANASISFLLDLQNRFYRRHSFPQAVIMKHRRHLYWIWGKHFFALTYRRNGYRDLTCRLTLLRWSTRLLIGMTPLARVTWQGGEKSKSSHRGAESPQESR